MVRGEKNAYVVVVVVVVQRCALRCVSELVDVMNKMRVFVFGSWEVNERWLCLCVCVCGCVCVCLCITEKLFLLQIV